MRASGLPLHYLAVFVLLRLQTHALNTYEVVGLLSLALDFGARSG